MKIQDGIFFATFLGLLALRRPKLFVWAGLWSLVFAVPLFATWTFFSAQRLTWYAGAFFLTSLVISLPRPNRVQ